MMQSIMFKNFLSRYIQVILILPESTLPDETKGVLDQRNAKFFCIFILCLKSEQEIVLIRKEMDRLM